MVFGFNIRDVLAGSSSDSTEHHEVVANDPNDPSTWTEKFKASSPQVKEYVIKLQEDINNLQAKWRDGYIRFDKNYHTVHDAHVARGLAWEEHRTRLQRSCEKLRDSLDRINEAKEMCTRMQGEEMPALFRLKAKDPVRFKRFGDIKGCLRQNFETGQYETANCECIAGTEQSGCTDAVGNVGNTLSCSHILNDQIPNMPLADFFKDGGACRVNNKEAWNDPIVSKKAFGPMMGVDEQAICPEAVNAMSVMPQCVSMLQRDTPCKRGHRSQRDLGSFFVAADALHNMKPR